MNDKIIIYNTDDGKSEVSLYAKNGDIWLSQDQIAELFDKARSTITEHISSIFQEEELEENSVCRNFRRTAKDGKDYNVAFYSLKMILAIGFRVRSKRGTQFRKWANDYLQDYVVKGFIIDTERLKNPDGRIDYFDELLEQIRDIRASEKRFYQKIRDLLKLSSDYDKTDKKTRLFFAEIQNKLLYAITGQTAAEIINSRADSNKSNMGLTAWKGKIVRKADIITAKNYLLKDELDSLNRLVVIFLETAELRAKNQKELTLKFWEENVDRILTSNDFMILNHKGKISHKKMEEKVNQIYSDFDKKRKKDEAKIADEEDLKDLENLIKEK